MGPLQRKRVQFTGGVCPGETGAIAQTGIIPTGYERTLPPEAQLLVRARRRALTRRARGAVLDLGGADVHRSLWDGAPEVGEATVLDGADDPELARLASDGARFDTIVSVFQLASSADLDATLRAVRTVLGEDGRLLFVEPGAQVGLSGRVMTGWRADRDVPMALRLAQLSVTDIERLRVPTLQVWIRQVLDGVAHHAMAPGGAAGSARTSGPA